MTFDEFFKEAERLGMTGDDLRRALSEIRSSRSPGCYLSWSEELPTEKGFYWWREKTDAPPFVRKIYVHVFDRWPGAPDWVYQMIDGSEVKVKDIGGQWAGPIPEPKDR